MMGMGMGGDFSMQVLISLTWNEPMR
jgi:hypothetical protein